MHQIQNSRPLNRRGDTSNLVGAAARRYRHWLFAIGFILVPHVGTTNKLEAEDHVVIIEEPKKLDASITLRIAPQPELTPHGIVAFEKTRMFPRNQMNNTSEPQSSHVAERLSPAYAIMQNITLAEANEARLRNGDRRSATPEATGNVTEASASVVESAESRSQLFSRKRLPLLLSRKVFFKGRKTARR